MPYPGTDLYEKVMREQLLANDDWTRMEYSYYLMSGNGLDEQVVMGAIRKAKRRFFLRGRYMRRHAADLIRLAVTKPGLVWQAFSRTLLGESVPDLRQDSVGIASEPVRPKA